MSTSWRIGLPQRRIVPLAEIAGNAEKEEIDFTTERHREAQRSKVPKIVKIQ